jgi:hypothetical protein
VEDPVESINQGVALCDEVECRASRSLVRQYIPYYSITNNKSIFLHLLLSTRRFIETKLPGLRVLNQNTFFALTQIPDSFDSSSACHVIFGDSKILLFI